MAEVRISGEGRTARTVTISFDQKTGDFPLDFESLQAKALAPVEDACWDFLEIAAAVFAADTSTRRGAATRPDFGASWRRSYAFSIPVVRLDIWTAPEMQEALVDAVSFLTEDEVRFSFTQKPATPCRQYPLIDDRVATPFPAAEVILFSGGLDLLAGAMERLTSSDDKVVLVTRESAPKETPRQKLLGQHLGRVFSGRVLHARFKATRAWGRSPDRTQRSRSFLFAALGYVHARIFGAPRISFYENGVISHNLPLSPQVVGTMATRTTHPLALLKLARIIDLLADALAHPRIELANPYRWLTKAEVVARLDAAGGAALIGKSVSCTSLRSQSRAITHCGACSQCLDRRFAIVAAGLEEHDPASAYQTDIFLGPRQTDRSRTMAIDWTDRGLAAADLDLVEFVSRNGQELTRIIAGYPATSTREVAAQAHQLHRRHGLSVKKALGRMVAAHADAIVARDLEATSLLRMILADRASLAGLLEQPRLRAQREDRDPGDLGVMARAGTPRKSGGGQQTLQVVFSSGPEGRTVVVIDLATLVGVQANLVHCLKIPFDEDRAAGRRLEAYRYTPAGRAHPEGKGAAKRCVNRVRAFLDEAYIAIEGCAPDRELLVETKKGSGYRLDPTINVVLPDSV